MKNEFAFRIDTVILKPIRPDLKSLSDQELEDLLSEYIERCQTKDDFFSLDVVCYAQIKDSFWLGIFGDFELVIDKSTEYFNATKLCKEGADKLNTAKSMKENADSPVPLKISLLIDKGVSTGPPFKETPFEMAWLQRSHSKSQKRTLWKGSLTKLGSRTIAENRKGFRDWFTIDTLPKKRRKNKNAIINLDISTGDGTHWELSKKSNCVHRINGFTNDYASSEAINMFFYKDSSDAADSNFLKFEGRC
ncbi:hypothetical protein TNIN_321801 [Trichonephila inaurata madagascariensis]|uniref:Uncharacterized protein n=1 Tax=Trichonephila inaurata madagascariensis TaxID=2747483 RepID=A0A8X6XKB4_9ARAC|nr:hypothetical protein TNIN_321801 [Trichonephila inaurata madagascariensis]